MCGDPSRTDTRHLLAVVGVALLLVFAGCTGLGVDDAGGGAGDAETYPGIFEEVTQSVDNETAAELRALVTDEDGELTDEGQAFLDSLETVDQLGTEQRDAVVESVVAEGALDGEVVERLDPLLASPDTFAAEALSAGLSDTGGDGLADGEVAALGLDPSDPDARVVDLAREYRDGGYDEHELAALQRLAELDGFGWQQADELGLLADLSDGEVTEEDVTALEDASGDGILNAMASELGVDADQPREDLADVVQALDDEAFTPLGLQYLERVAVVLDDEVATAQATYLGLLDVDGTTLTQADVAALEDTAGDGLLDGMEHELGLDPEESDPDVADIAAHLAADGYGDREIQYVERVIELREYRGHEYEYWAQAEQLGLFGEEIADGSVTEDHLWKLGNDAENRLLNAMEVEFGTDPDVADTSGDGYEDHLLWGPMQDLGLEVSPDSPNIYVEVDTADGINEPSDEQIEAIQRTFENEPSENIGSINIQFHVCHTEQRDIARPDDIMEVPIPPGVSTFEELEAELDPDDVPDPTADQRNISGMGFKYLWLTDGLVAGGTQGFAPAQWVMDLGEIKSFAVVDGRIWRTSSEMHQAGTIAHELGHALGIGGHDYVGVDSREVPADEYESVMNYNHPIDDVTFSTGEPFNDYQHMANQTFNSQYQDRSTLESMWENGSVNEDVLC